MGDRKLYITCPVCGKKMCKANLTAQLELRCPLCGSDLYAEIGTERKVTVQVMKEGKVSATA